MKPLRYGYQEGDEVKPPPPDALMGITESDVQAILQEINLVQLLSEEYNVELVESGGGKYLACCPFPNHDDSNPSFWVYGHENRFKCYGCSAAGTAIGAVMRMERISYHEAVCKLAQMVGYEAFLTPEGSIDRTLKEINNLVSDAINVSNGEYPLGLSEIGFLTLVKNRLQAYCEVLGVTAIDPYVDGKYKELDDLLESNQISQTKKFWHELDEDVRARIIACKKPQC